MSVVKLMVVKRRNQVEAQPEPLATVAVTLRQNPKDLQAADYMLHHKPLLGQAAVLGLLLFGKRMQLAPLVRQAVVGVTLDEAQITAVC